MGRTEFENFYQSCYGTRWPQLYAALAKEEKQVHRQNLFASNFPDWDGSGEIPRASNGVLAYYVMDPSSQCVAQALNVKPEDKVLDLCAAPGGKALILAEMLGDQGFLLANEISQSRRERLKKVFQQYIPREQREIIHMSGKDGGLLVQKYNEYFDKILVDAPCSGERHLLRNKREMDLWTAARSKKLAQRQYSLLTAALLMCKNQGRIIYSTCALSPLENDGVIDRLLQKKAGTFRIEKLPTPEGAETTQHGVIFLPDQSGLGPMYYCCLVREKDVSESF